MQYLNSEGQMVTTSGVTLDIYELIAHPNVLIFIWRNSGVASEDSEKL